MIPLWKVEYDVVHELIRKHAPLWSDFQIKSTGKYLGFMIGPGSDKLSWKKFTDKYFTSVEEIKAAGLGTGVAMRMYNTKAISALAYVAQLEVCPQSTLAKERMVLQRLLRAPWNTLTSRAICNTSQLGTGIECKSVMTMNIATLLRVACDGKVRLNDSGPAANPKYDDAEARLCIVADLREHRVFQHVSFRDTIERAVAGAFLPDVTATSFRLRLKAIVNSSRNPKAIKLQSLLYIYIYIKKSGMMS